MTISRYKVFTALAICLVTLKACQQSGNSDHTETDQRAVEESRPITEMPEDFSFKVKGQISVIDSKALSYTRLYLRRDSTIAMSFSKEELAQIYLSYYENGIDSLPSGVDLACGYRESPAVYEDIEVIHQGKNHNFTYFPQEKERESPVHLNEENFVIEYPIPCDAITKERIQRIERFAQCIHLIVSQKPSVKNLPPTDVVRM
jgi:hypothetical protein